MGCITAPVVGSGDWPAWMVRVLKPWRVSLVFTICSGDLLEAQTIQKIAAGHEAEEAVPIHDGDRGLDLHEGEQGFLALGHVYAREVRIQRGAHLLGEP